MEDQEVEDTEEEHVDVGELGAAPHGHASATSRSRRRSDVSSPERSSAGSRERRAGTDGARGRKLEVLGSCSAVASCTSKV